MSVLVKAGILVREKSDMNDQKINTKKIPNLALTAKPFLVLEEIEKRILDHM